MYNQFQNFYRSLWKAKTVPFASSKMKNILVLLAQSKFALKLICWIALGSASNACSLLCSYKSIAIIL